MKLLKSLPPNRPFEQIKNHYLVEKAIAERLKNASREERKLIYATMNDEVFRQVPDHPRLSQRNDERQTRIANKSKLALVREFLNPSRIFVEFGPGDCRFALEVVNQVKTVYAIDISDQRGESNAIPENFTLIIYDGYQLDEIQGSSIDLVFSDQFLEHLHPEDTRLHFELAYHILKPGGKYIFRTPHAFTGPHDVSQYFSNDPQGFHLKEWTYIEFKQLFKELNFSQFYAIWQAKGIRLRLPYFYVQACEHMLNLFPRRYKRALARYLVPSICIVAIK
jgi:SAM-dependent methyltransferase